MNVQVKNGLAGIGANIEYGAVSALDVALASDLRGGQMTSADRFRISSLGFL